MQPQVSSAFLKRSAHYLADDYLPKIARCVEGLNEQDIWWRPNESSNSVGNLILHLTGNLRQWIVSGVGGAADIRERQKEFDEQGPIPEDQLMIGLRTVVDHAQSVLLNLDSEKLFDEREIQGTTLSVLDAIYHAVEHFSMHTGQIIYLTKLRKGEDLAFYEVTDDGIAFPRW